MRPQAPPSEVSAGERSGRFQPVSQNYVREQSLEAQREDRAPRYVKSAREEEEEKYAQEHRFREEEERFMQE